MATALLKKPARHPDIRKSKPNSDEQDSSKQASASIQEEQKQNIKKENKRKGKSGWEMSARDALSVNYVDKEL